MAEMLRTMRNQITYANVVGTLALFIALGGASYAAATIPANSVGTPQLRSSAVTTSKLGVALGADSSYVQGPLTIPGFSCVSSTPGGPAPACPPPRPGRLATTTVTTRQRGNLLVLGTGIVDNPSSAGRALGIELSASVDHGHASSPGLPVSFTSVSPGDQQTATFIATYRGVPAGHHVIELLAGGGPAGISEVQLSAVAEPESP